MAPKAIFEPIRIGGVEIANRIVRAAHGTHLARHAFDDDSIAYRVARAKGGCGLTIIEAASVHPSSENTLFNIDDRVIPGFEAMMRAVRPYGMKVFEQLFHGGRQTFGEGRRPPWSASDVPNSILGAVPVPMGEPEIEEIIGCFASAAKRCQEGGLDGVEIHAAHGYLIHQFLSPITNRREDRWGGSLENRMRFLRKITRAIRKAVGHDYVVGIRISASTAVGGLHEPEIRAITQALIDENLLDYVDTTMRTVPALEWLYQGDFEILVRYRLVEIAPGVTTVQPFQSQKPRKIDADTVVLITPNQPMRSLYDELRQQHKNIALVGDASAPRDLCRRPSPRAIARCALSRSRTMQ